MNTKATKKRGADVIVIGGGVVGNACAYNLAKRGVDVLVLEREESLGEGGSRAAARHVRRRAHLAFPL